MRGITAFIIIVLFVAAVYLVIKNKAWEKVGIVFDDSRRTQGTQELSDSAQSPVKDLIEDGSDVRNEAKSEESSRSREEVPNREETRKIEKEVVSPPPEVPRQNPNPIDPLGGTGSPLSEVEDENNGEGGVAILPAPGSGDSGSQNPPGDVVERPVPPSDPCAISLSGQLQTYDFNNDQQSAQIDCKGIFKDLIPDYLAAEERFSLHLAYYEPSVDGGEREIKRYCLVIAEQMDPIIKEELTLTGFAVSLHRSRVLWFRDQIGGGYCLGRFRFVIYNARTGDIKSQDHFSFIE